MSSERLDPFSHISFQLFNEKLRLSELPYYLAFNQATSPYVGQRTLLFIYNFITNRFFSDCILNSPLEKLNYFPLTVDIKDVSPGKSSMILSNTE